MTPKPPPPERPRPPWHVTPAPVRAAGAVIGLTMLVVIIGLAVGWPAVRPTPHDVPIGVSAPLTVERIQPQLDGIAADGFTVTSYPDRDTLRSAIRARKVYGGLTAGPEGTSLFTATGASPQVAQLLARLGHDAAPYTGVPLYTEDLAPLPATDPHGSGLPAAALALTLAGLLPALVLPMLFPRQLGLQFITTAAFSIVVAVALALVLQGVFGTISGTIGTVIAGLALGVLAMGLVLLGLGALFGRTALAVGVMVWVVLGHPLSGLISAPELLPRGWGAFGQLLPQGANATLLRSTAFFAGAGAGTAILVLSCWVAVGALLVGIAELRERG